jgi:FtsZ-binding cell division protein ZapB
LQNNKGITTLRLALLKRNTITCLKRTIEELKEKGKSFTLEKKRTAAHLKKRETTIGATKRNG